MAEWIAAARETTGRSASAAARSTGARPSSAPERDDLDAIRARAREDGHTVAGRGRVERAVIDAHDNR